MLKKALCDGHFLRNSLSNRTGKLENLNREMELPNRELLNCSRPIRPIREFGNSNSGVINRRVFCVSGFRSRTPHILAGDGRARAFVSNMPLLRRKAEHLGLPGPFGWQVGEAGNSHPMREPPVDGGLDEIGREEGKRDCHISSRLAMLSVVAVSAAI